MKACTAVKAEIRRGHRAGRLTHSLPQPGLSQQSQGRVRDDGRVIALYEESGLSVSHYFRIPANAPSYRRNAGSHVFENGIGQSFGIRSQQADVEPPNLAGGVRDSDP